MPQHSRLTAHMFGFFEPLPYFARLRVAGWPLMPIGIIVPSARRTRTIAPSGIEIGSFGNSGLGLAGLRKVPIKSPCNLGSEGLIVPTVTFAI